MLLLVFPHVSPIPCTLLNAVLLLRYVNLVINAKNTLTPQLG